MTSPQTKLTIQSHSHNVQLLVRPGSLPGTVRFITPADPNILHPWSLQLPDTIFPFVVPNEQILLCLVATHVAVEVVHPEPQGLIVPEKKLIIPGKPN